jgi:hypothetical protein
MAAGLPTRAEEPVTCGVPTGLRRHALLQALGFAAFGMVADLDLLVERHSQFTHSIGMALAVGVTVFVLLRWHHRHPMPESTATPGHSASVTVDCARRAPHSTLTLRTGHREHGTLYSDSVLALAACAAYSSHILLDWLAQDATAPLGITALWPFSSAYYLSHLDWFWGISREPWRPGAAWHDVVAITREVLMLGPLTLAAWMLRRGGRQVLPTGQASGRQHLQSAVELPRAGESDDAT